MNNYLVAIEAMENLLDLSGQPPKSFNRQDYKQSFQQYYQNLVPAFEAIEALYGSVDEPQSMLENMADALTNKAVAYMSEVKGRNQKEIQLMNLNMQLAVFLYPSILNYKGASSQPFAEIIRKKWKDAFPKAEVQIASFEQIESGFHRKFCYITTAVCSVLGKPDDCYELELLRDYRDNYLSNLDGGEEMIHMYYDIAPSIVKHIDARSDSKEIYEYIMNKYIAPCISMIEQGDRRGSADLYTEMVYTLKDRYFYS